MELQNAIENFMSGYFSTCRRSVKTHQAYSVDLKQFCNYFGEKPIGLVSAESIERWAEELKSQGYAPVSIRRKFATLRVFFAYWVRKAEVAGSPLWKIRLDLGRQVQLPRGLAASDAKLLLEKAWSRTVVPEHIDRSGAPAFLLLRNLVAVEVLFATGMRVGELVSLRTSDWREDEGSFLVRGKGARQRLALIPDERSTHAIKTYLRFRKFLKVDHDSLLVNAAGGKLSTQGVSRLLAALAAEAQIERRVTPHMIRHTVATLLLRHGADIRVVQEVLGHASIMTTQRYTHVSKEHLVETLRAHHPSRHFGITREFCEK